MTPRSISGLNRNVRGPVGNVQATASCATFDRLIWSRAEYCEECCPP